MAHPALKLKLAVIEAPVINGFSYAFTRLLANRFRKLESEGELFLNKQEDVPEPNGVVNGEAQIILQHLADQTRSTCPCSVSGDVYLKELNAFMDTVEKFLAIFLATEEELHGKTSTVVDL